MKLVGRNIVSRETNDGITRRKSQDARLDKRRIDARRREARRREQRKKRVRIVVAIILFIVTVMLIGGILKAISHIMKDDPFKEATILLEEYDYEGAIELYKVAIEEENNVAVSHRGMGLAYWELEQYDAAKTELLQSIKQGAAATSTVYNMLLTLEMEAKNYTEALNYIQIMLGLSDLTDEMKQQILKYEIICYEAVFNWDLVKEKLNAYLTLYPDDKEMVKEAEFFATR